MKRIYLPIIAAFLLFCSRVSAQDWTEMMRDHNANVHDVQKAFNQWYGQSKPEGNEEEDGNFELYKRWEWFMLPRTYPSGNKPDMVSIAKQYQDYINNNAHKAGMHRIEAAARWSYAGTSNVPLGGEAGRINRIRFNPTNSNIVYACAPSGGLWKSTNGGSGWTTTTDQLADLATSDVAIDPTNTNIMYLATGDGDGITGGETTPSTIGVLKSTDGGKTWVATSLFYTLQNSGPPETTVNELAINPQNHNSILAATSSGVYVSPNAGITWNLILSGNIKDIAFNPSNPSIAYASDAFAHFYRSTDGGYSFTRVTLPGASGIGRVALAVTPANSDYVYVLADNSSDYSFGGLWLSKDDGQTFTLQSTSPNLLGPSPNGGSGGQGWYTLSIAASPTNASEVIVGGVNIWRSTNAGVNWALNADQAGFGHVPYVHADIHHLTYLNGTTYFAGCDGGVFKTSNSGTNWNDLSNGLEIAEQYSIGLSASSPNYWITGWQDNGTNLNSGGSWTEVLGGDGMVCFVDFSNNNNLYGETYQGGFNFSSNGGANFNNIAINTPEAAAWVTPWMQDPSSASTLFAGLENVWKSTNKGTSWDTISHWGTSGNYIVTLAVAPSNDKYVYAATYFNLEMTSTGGEPWKSIASGLPLLSTVITSVAVDPNNPLRVWVTFSGYSATDKVYQSVNGGTSWTNISNGLPNLPVNCIVYQKGGVGDAMYVGTDMGVYYRDTVNTGGNWVSYNAGLPNVMVADLKIYSPTNMLRAATYGRGTWQVATYTASAVKPIAYFSAYPTSICAGNTVQLTDSSANSPTSWNWTLAGGNPSTSTAQNPTVFYSTAGNYAVKLVATNSHGSDSLTTVNYIKVNPIPPAPNITQNGMQLTVTPSGYPFYQWFLGNTFLGSTNQNQSWIDALGTYKVIMSDSNGCTNSGQLDVTVLTGINNISADDGINAYPNPTSGNLQLVFNLPNEGDYELSVSDVLGQIIYTDKIHIAGQYSSSLNMANYSKGVYFLSVTGTNSKIIKKIVVY